MRDNNPMDGYRAAEPHQGYVAGQPYGGYVESQNQAGEQAPPAPPYAAQRPEPYEVPGQQQSFGQQSFGQQPAQPHGQPYAAPGPHGGATTEKNWMAIVALVGALLVFAPLGIIFGHLGRSAAAQGRATNRGLATAGMVVGYVGTAIWLFAIAA
ncbi:DUF4190 domain-containing protein [Demequina pelophila]|uniref:DUF4190 domain-containing protein n=1 Tax=Demequina pelophila TaxID=1638984 RepID=UPI00078196CB|nr:DUF4190 domain-containing protein [Demequina pelophila]